MRKFFTFAAAVLATMAMNAGTKIYSFADTTELNTLTYTAGDASDSWGVYTVKTNNVTPRDGGFAQYKCAKSSKIATFVTQESFESISNISFYIASSDKGKTQVKVEISPNADFSADVTEVVNATAGLSGLGISSPSNNIWYPVSLDVENVSGYVRFSMTATSSGKYWSYDSLAIAYSGVPSTDSVATATISGADSCYVGKSVTLTCTAEHATTYQWYNTNGIIEGATAKTYVFTPDAEGTYGFYCLASNQYNTNPVRSNSHVVTATVKPAAVPCAAIIPATSGDSLQVGDEVALDATSEGGKIFVAGMKTSKSSISYNALGLMLGGGGADSIRVEFNNLIAEGSVIKLVMAAGGTSERGLNLQTVAKSNQFQAKWTPTAVGEVREFEYTVPAGSKLIGDYRILLQRNNTVYLQSVSMADCGAARPGTTVISKVETLTGVAINDGALNGTDFAELFSAKTLFLEDSSYVEAPVVKFTKHVVTTYEDQSTKEKDEVIAVTSQQATASTWGATATINNVAYSVYTVKQLSYTVNYYDGETLLGTEPVAQGANATKYEQYSVKPLSQFVGWYTDAALTQPVESWTVMGNMNVYGKWTKLFASSVNIEQFVLDYGKKTAAFKDTLTAHGWTYSNINDLDSLNDDKTARNEPYLGLKLKAKGASVAGWIHNGDTITVKFGNVGDSVIARINGQEMKFSKDYLNSSTLGRRATADEYLELVTTSGSTVVLKQFMINENIQDVVLPAATKFQVTCAEPEHGTVKVGGKTSAMYAPNDTVVLTLTPAEGYHIDDVRYNDGVEDHVITPVNNVYWFIMPAAEVNVAAFFAADQPVIAGYMVTPDNMNLPIRLTYAATMVQDTLVAAGTTVTMRYEMLDAEWRFEHFVVYKTGDSALVAMNTDSTFIMPEYDVTFTATCVQKEPTQYTVSIAKMTNGQVTLTDSDNQFEAGDTVQLRITPAEGYELEAIGLEGIELAIVVENGLGTFVMPAQNVTVVATFKLIPVTPMYLVTIAATQNGSVRITNLGNEDNKFYENDVVYISVTPAEGYEIESASLEGLELAINLDEDGNGSFNMPGQNVTLIATFKPVGEGIDDINADTKAVKRMINGVLVIEKNGKFFNAQGAELK